MTFTDFVIVRVSVRVSVRVRVSQTVSNCFKRTQNDAIILF